MLLPEAEAVGGVEGGALSPAGAAAGSAATAGLTASSAGCPVRREKYRPVAASRASAAHSAAMAFLFIGFPLFISMAIIYPISGSPS